MLPNEISANVLCNRRKAGILTRVRDHAHLVLGLFNEFVPSFSCMLELQIVKYENRVVVETDMREHKQNDQNCFSYSFRYYCWERCHIARSYKERKSQGNKRRDPGGVQCVRLEKQRVANQF